jgi:hypothetical protein
MDERPYKLIRTPTGVVTRIRARGSAALSTPTINRGTAFTLEERQVLGLTGLLPPQVTTLDGQPLYVYAHAQYRAQTSDLGRNVYFPALLRAGPHSDLVTRFLPVPQHDQAGSTVRPKGVFPQIARFVA